MKAQIVSFHCVLKNKLGQTLSSSFNREVINQLDKSVARHENSRLRGLIAGIQNVRQGERREIYVPADEAYGLYNPDLVVKVPRLRFPNGESLVVGSEIVGRAGPEDSKRTYRVIQVAGNILVLDGNHPLAGQDLVFEVNIISAREACMEDFDEPFMATASDYIH